MFCWHADSIEMHVLLGVSSKAGQLLNRGQSGRSQKRECCIGCAPLLKAEVGSGNRGGARPIQLFEGSRPWGGICKLNGVGVKRKPSGKGSGIEERSAGVGALVVCVGIRARV